MVRFGETLERGAVPEWQPYYCSYARLNGIIEGLEMFGGSGGDGGASASPQRAGGASDVQIKAFFEELAMNLKRVDQFYTTQEARARSEFQRLHSVSGQLKDDSVRSEFQRDIAALDKRLDMLILFASQNAEAFRKITKKFDKKVGVANLSKQSLQDFVICGLAKYSFAQAEVRLVPLKNVVSTWMSADVEQLKNDCSTDDLHELLLPPEWQRHCTLGLDEYRKELEPAESRWQFLKDAVDVLRENVLIVILSIVVFVCSVYVESNVLTRSSWFVIWVVLVALVLLVQGAETDAVMMGATLLLNATGILDLTEAWGAFSNDVVLAVASLGGVSSALGRTGIIDKAFGPFLGTPKSYPMALLRVAIPTVLFNVGISNTCVMSCLMPVVEKWSADIGIHQALLLLPISYLLLISGVIAMFSTSTNLVCQGQLQDHGLEQFDQFALALPGVVCTVASLAYMIAVVPIVLSRFRVNESLQEGKTSDKPSSSQRVFNVLVQVVGTKASGETAASSGLLAALGGGISDVIACERYGERLNDFSEDFELRLDDVLYLRCNINSIVKLSEMPGIKLLTQDQSHPSGSLGTQRELVQVVLSEKSPMVGFSLQDAKEHASYGCSVIAYRPIRSIAAQGPNPTMAKSRTRPALVGMMSRTQSISPTPRPGGETDISAESSVVAAAVATKLRLGDSLVFNAPVEFYRSFRDSNDFVVISRVTRAEGQGRLRDRLPTHAGPISGIILLTMIGLVASNTVKLLQGVLLALVALIATRCTTLDEVFKAVKLRTVCVIVGSFGLGKAIGKEHVSTALAQLLISMLSPFGEIGYLSAVFMATVALGVVFHGIAVVILMFPVCLEMASQSGVPTHQIMAVLCLAAACQLLSPISYQTNLMAYTAASYTFVDFTYVGIGMVLIIGVIGVPMCQYCFPN
eukprot:TRINITY_DN11597_c0_g3_i1.p1 TRINITY_DN11597_c0_g3~~TRINITY_DN11597_c0_g3_i1.p1  ORF type:complete len:919 (-),score=118.75 TRINITY_DN11597_c0_g3_i1:56-2812(-)